MSSANTSLKKELYQLLQKEPNIYEFIQNNGGNGVWYWSLTDSTHQWADMPFWELLGYTYEEVSCFDGQYPRILDYSDLDIIIDEAIPTVPTAPNSVADFDVVLPFINRKGSTVWLKCTGVVLADAVGKPSRVLGVNSSNKITDLSNFSIKLQPINESQVTAPISAITEAKAAQISFQHKILTKISTTPLETYGSLNNYIKMATEGLCEGLMVSRASVWDYTKESIVCKDLYDTTSGTHTDNMELCAKDFPSYFYAVDNGWAIIAHDAHTNPYTFEFSEIYLKPLGINSMLDVPVRSGGVLVGVVCCEDTSGERTWLDCDVNFAHSIADIISLAIEADKRRETERELHKIQMKLAQTSKLARLGGWELDTTVGIFIMSDIAADIMEMPHGVTFTIPEAMQIVDEDSGSARIFINAMENLMQHALAFDIEILVNISATKSIWLRTIGQCDMALDGRTVSHIFGSFQDITAQKAFQQELIDTRKRAEIANQAKSDFLANMSHEIRTPLNGVIGFTDLLMRTKLNKTQQQYMSTVLHSANALLDIINDILDFSKLEVNKLELNVEQTDVLELCNQVTDIITFQANQKELELLLNVAPNIPRHIRIDGFRLRQILVNLMGNAIKFTDTGEVELKIEILEDYGDKQKLRFSVRDTGIGIEKHNQCKIFEAFSQEDASTTRKFGGTGLGLTISNRLLALMESGLQVFSAVGEGSTFFFELNVEVDNTTVLENDTIDGIKKVLVVDDNTNNRLLLKEMLAFKQIEVHEAIDGIEGIAMATKNDYDVIIMDYHMPKMNGIDTIRHIREQLALTSDVLPIILLYSSSDDEYIAASCAELEVAHKMVKPVKMNDFFTTLSNLQLKNNLRLAPVNLGNSVTDYNGIEENTTVMPDDDTVPHILIVEDNPINLFLLKSILHNIIPDARISEAENGKIAIAKIDETLPDLIFMDLQMPEMNGYEATHALRELNIKVPIIALTAGALHGEKDRCFEAGMTDFITKPVMETTIKRMIDTWLPPPNAITRHFNRPELEARLNNRLPLVEKVIDMTKVSIDELVDVLGENAASNDYSMLKANAHKLKGVALSVSLGVLTKQAQEIEHNADTMDALAINALVRAMQTERDYIKTILR